MTEITAAEIAADRASCCSAESCGCCRDALKYIAAYERLQNELARVTAERDAARRALESLNNCPFNCQWELCTECEAALIAALPEKP